jgi:hypothetical protein
VIALSSLLGVQVVRNAAVQANAEFNPKFAARIWPSHPSVEIFLGLAEIGRAARERKAIDPSTFSMIDDAALKSPLSPEPYLVRGVRAQMSGDAEAAAHAFLEAQWRDPRSLPAAYFLGTYYFSRGRVSEGLMQAAILGKLSPGGAGAIAPFLAEYGRIPSNWPEIRSFFRREPYLEDAVLASLAADGGNAQAILAIADEAHRRPDSPWLKVLVNSLINGGDYSRARQIWSEVGEGAVDHSLVFDPQFSNAGPPPPFNWTLASSAVGLAERQPGNRLHVLFYGNQDGVLASQLVLLPAGTYRLEMHLAGPAAHPQSLRWSIRCDKAPEPLADIRLDAAAMSGWTFEIPGGCPAQWLELSGQTSDFTDRAEAIIGRFRLTRVARGA